MIEQEKQIREWCKKEGFNFVNCDDMMIKLPCSLDKNYKEDNQTFFISGFYNGSKRIGYSRGGLKCILTLKVPIEKIPKEEIREQILPVKWICDKCKKKNFNLRTQDNHKTYNCPECYNKNISKENNYGENKK